MLWVQDWESVCSDDLVTLGSITIYAFRILLVVLGETLMPGLVILDIL